MLEVFIATEKDTTIKSRQRKASFVGQVGIRCVYCVPQLDAKERADRAYMYPTSVSKFYQSVNDMIHYHMVSCCAIPPKLRNTYNSLSAARRVCDTRLRANAPLNPKEFWEKCCLDWGMVDSVGEKVGVKLSENHTMVPRSRKEFLTELQSAGHH